MKFFFQIQPNIRINHIKELIRNCKYGIHDLSRSKALTKGELPRFNIPYELGLDIGALSYRNPQLKNKKILILETEKYHYQKVISDIAGQDIENHNDDAYTLITNVRNWFSVNFMETQILGQRIIWNAYNQLIDDLTTTLKEEKYTDKEIDEMTIADFIKFSRIGLKNLFIAHGLNRGLCNFYKLSHDVIPSINMTNFTSDFSIGSE